MDDATPDLGIGFLIDTGASYDELMRLQALMESAEVKIVREAASIERATGGMIKVGGQSAQITAVANETTRAARDIAREKARAEKAGEALIRQLERESAAYGKSRDQIRLMKAESAALAAEKAGNADLAARILKAEADINAKEFAAMRAARYEAQAAAEDSQVAADKAASAAQREAQAVRDAANAYRLFEAVAKQKSAAYRDQQARETAAAMDAEATAASRLAREHDALAAKVRESHAAQEADAVAAERLRMSTDPLYAALKRINEEIAESTRLYYAGATAQEEYARQQGVLAGRLEEVERAQGAVNRDLNAVGNTGRVAGHHIQNLFFQFQDLGVGMIAAAGSSAPLKMAFTTLIQQGAQIQGVMMQSGLSVRGLGAEIGGMTSRAAAAHPVLLGLTAAAGAFAGAIGLIGDSARDRAEMEAYVKSLGLTAKEIRHLNDVTITWGDTAKAVFQVAGRAIWDYIGPAVTSTWDVMKEWLAWIGGGIRSAVNFMIGGFVGAYNVITKHWRSFPAVIGEFFFSAVNFAIDAINTLIRKTVDGLNAFIATANAVLGKAGLELPTLSAPQIDRVNNQYAGAGKKFGETVSGEMGKAMSKDWVGDISSTILDPIMEQRRKNAQERLRKQAEEKGYLDPEKGKTDKNAERLAREAAATEAQIRNLYALAEAYKVSGAAALIAEARVKAESEAIKKRGDIEAMVNRQIRLAIAERVVDAAKSTAAARDQAAAQEEVNAMVSAGIIPAEAAADLVKDQIADLPLLAALQAAQQLGLEGSAKKATEALEDQRRARLRLRAAEETQRFNADIAAGNNRLAEIREELGLLQATSAERVHALALVKATQEAQAKFSDPAQRDAYIGNQVAIADAQEALRQKQAQLNEELSVTAQLSDDLGASLSQAFGKGGAALGDMISILGRYGEEQARIAQQVKDGQISQAAGAKLAANAQLSSLVDITGAAKNLFKQHSAGYKAMAAAEKAFAIVQLINTGINVAAGAAKMFATLGPFAFPAVAAMIGVMASLGFSSGGKSNGPAPTNDGSGTVLGDSKAKSESITRALSQLREIDTAMLSYSRQMAASLHSIENQIGGVASLIVRNAEGITSTSNIKEGFNSNAGTVLAGIGGALFGVVGAGIGALLTKIPIVGDILKDLFGTKTTVLGSGLYGGSQSLGSILAGGYDASTYVDIQKKKKLFGVTTSNKTSTQYSAVDPALEQQFALILRSFNQALLAAAGPLGFATTEIQQRLNSFVFSLGKIDLRGLTGEQIEEKLTAVFGAAADNMARAAFPGFERFQKAGEGLFETLVRVASTAEVVTSSFALLGSSAQAMGLDAKIALADQFESLSALTAAVDTYFSQFYTKEEQAAARTAQLAKVFQGLGLSLPTSLAAFRALVEAQDLTTEAGRSVYATLLQLAPAFADLQSAMEGAKSAADIAAERQDLERQLLELRGDTAALRALELAKLDASNRALQLEIWAIQDAQEAAKAAEELRKAWTSVGDSIMDEVRRIRGLSDTAGANTYAALLGQFNAATTAARGGDQDAAKSLPQLSQALLAAAADAATSRQELDRIRAQTAASLEATYGLLSGLMVSTTSSTSRSLFDALLESQPATAAINDNGTNGDRFEELRAETEQLRADLTAALAQIAANTGKVAKKLDDVTSQSGGDAISTVSAAA